MSRKIAKLFICTGLFFLAVGCIEGLMFPTKMPLKSFYSAVFQIPPNMVKSFFAQFVAKIHTHVNLIGWVGSVLMGLLYFIAPQIAGQNQDQAQEQKNYPAMAAYLNWGVHTLGLLMMVIGFHLIGHIGLSAGFEEGSTQFRQVVAPVKNLVMGGGILITLSVFLFIYNMIRILFSSVKAPQKARGLAAAAVGLVVISLVFPLGTAQAKAVKINANQPEIMVGDRLVDVTNSLGALPSAMSVRCSMWPLCDTMKYSVQVLGCPSCLTKKKGEPLLKFARDNNISRVLIEKNDQFCLYMPELDLSVLGKLLSEKGLTVEYVDFNQGLPTAVKQTAEKLSLSGKADSVLADYKKNMEQTQKFIKERSFAGTVVIVRGTYQAQSGKTFLRIEAPGGYTDKFILEPLGIKNSGGLAVPEGKKIEKGHILVRTLSGLLKAAPDAIVMTGDAIAVQKAFARALEKTPALADVPAFKDHAIYSLPGYIDSSVIEYPEILKQWADVLAR